MITENTSNVYGKMLGWEVWNFMSIEYAKVEFDESGIINFKGYNDSGKSAMLRALDVLFYNITPSQQTSFIKDGKDYFRIIAYFDEGAVLRDKYINGQSLYEIYRGNEVVFTTKQNGVLTKVSAVPDIVQRFLGVITSDAWNINTRSCFEKQLLVETGGGENYRSLNEVLRAEELAKAGEFLNTDKNKLQSELKASENELEIYKRQIRGSIGVTDEFMAELKSLDEKLDLSNNSLNALENCNTALKNIAEIPEIPEIPMVDISQVNTLNVLSTSVTELNTIPDIAELPSIETTNLGVLSELQSCIIQLNAIPDIPKLNKIDKAQVDALQRIKQTVNLYEANNKSIEDLDAEMNTIATELQTYQKELESMGHKYIVCQNCGAYVPIDAGSEHTH